MKNISDFIFGSVKQADLVEYIKNCTPEEIKQAEVRVCRQDSKTISKWSRAKKKAGLPIRNNFDESIYPLPRAS